MPADDQRVTHAYIAVRYAECFSRPTRVHPAGCGCDESSCEYSRIRESFEIKVLWKLPESHVKAHDDDEKWCNVVHTTPAEILTRWHTFPVPPCPECVLDPWVVLATITIPPNQEPSNSVGLTISYKDRRVLLATQRLQTAMLCLP